MLPVANFTMNKRKEQRVGIKFCARIGISATETLTKIQQAFREPILSRTQVFQWHARFKTGRTSVGDDEHTGRPTSCTPSQTVARIQELVRQVRRRTITLLRMWELVMGHANGFCLKNLACLVSRLHHDNTPSHTSVLI
jgi:hypothetical protein